MRNIQTSPTNRPVVFKFWSDSNLSNFERDLSELGVRYEQDEKGAIRVYDDSREVKNLALDYGADTY